MAHLVVVQILVDEHEESRVVDGINEMLKTAQQPVEEGGPSWIVDWSIASARKTLKELDDSLVNEIYAEGDAFRNWVAFSASEASSLESGSGYWSNQFGWTSVDLATKFDPVDPVLPPTGADDVVWMLAPYNN